MTWLKDALKKTMIIIKYKYMTPTCAQTGHDYIKNKLEQEECRYCGLSKTTIDSMKKIMQKTSEPMQENWPSYLKQEKNVSEPMQEDKIFDVEHLAMNIVYQLGDALEVPVEIRQRTNDSNIDFVMKLISRILKQEKEKSYQEKRQDIMNWVYEKGLEFGEDFGYRKARQELKDELVEEIKTLSLGKYKSIVGNDEAYGYGLALSDLINLIKTK